METYRVKHPKSPSLTWKSFLANHLTDLVAIDFFVVPTMNFKVLYILVVLAHYRRGVIYFNVTKSFASSGKSEAPIGAMRSGNADGEKGCRLRKRVGET